MLKTTAGLFLALSALLAGAGQGAEWKTFESKEGDFRVLFPGKPMRQTQEIPVPGGKTKLHLFLVSPQDDRVYMVSYNDYPEAVVKAQETKTLLDNVVKGNVESLKGKVLSQKEITLGQKKHPGRAVLIENNEGAQYKAKVFLVGNRLYQVVALGPKEFIEQKETGKYLDSFDVTK